MRLKRRGTGVFTLPVPVTSHGCVLWRNGGEKKVFGIKFNFQKLDRIICFDLDMCVWKLMRMRKIIMSRVVLRRMIMLEMVFRLGCLHTYVMPFSSLVANVNYFDCGFGRCALWEISSSDLNGKPLFFVCNLCKLNRTGHMRPFYINVGSVNEMNNCYGLGKSSLTIHGMK